MWKDGSGIWKLGPWVDTTVADSGGDGLAGMNNRHSLKVLKKVVPFLVVEVSLC